MPPVFAVPAAAGDIRDGRDDQGRESGPPPRRQVLPQDEDESDEMMRRGGRPQGGSSQAALQDDDNNNGNQRRAAPRRRRAAAKACCSFDLLAWCSAASALQPWSRPRFLIDKPDCSRSPIQKTRARARLSETTKAGVLVMDLVEVVRGPANIGRDGDARHGHGAPDGPHAGGPHQGDRRLHRQPHPARRDAGGVPAAGCRRGVSFEDIDTAVEKGLNWPMGPFRLGDFSGLDVTYNARLHMYGRQATNATGRHPSWRRRSRPGKLGRKTGEGWYNVLRRGSASTTSASRWTDLDELDRLYEERSAPS